MNMPTRAQFVEAARTYALAYGRQEDAPSYLPRTVNDAQAFEPHAWVIGAMMQAFSDGVKDGRDAERQAAALPKLDDAKRLDYLQEKQSTISIVPHGSDHTGTRFAFMVGGWHCSVNRDVRAAIDLAMDATPEEISQRAALGL